ncbi:MAG: universal stress protein [Thiotrichaceae bacterium]
MKKYKNILACIDLSKISEEVIIRANEIANFYKAHLVILYVNYDMPPLSEPFGEPASLLLDAELRKKLEERALQELGNIILQSGLSELVPVEVIDGHPKTIILDYAKKHHIDLILMGRHQRPAILDLLGSTANTVLHKTKADVLLVTDAN